MAQITLLNSSDYTIQTTNGQSKLDITMEGLTYKVNNLLLNEYKDSSTPNYTFESKLVAITKELDDSNNLTFNLAWKQTSSNSNGYIYNTNWTFTKLSRDTSVDQFQNILVRISIQEKE
jgi:hypothetical protein